MVDLTTLPDPSDSNWDDRAGEIVEGTGVDPGLGKDLLRDAKRVVDGDLELPAVAGRYPTRVVETLGVDDALAQTLDDPQWIRRQREELPVTYSAHDSVGDIELEGESEEAGEDADRSGDKTSFSCGCESDSSCGCESQTSSACGSGNSCGCKPGTSRQDVTEILAERHAGKSLEELANRDPAELYEMYDVDTSASVSTEMENLGQDWDLSDVDERWEANARADLDDVEFDTELGVEMARDALRISQGELSEARFHQKHHAAVVDEFGIDHRPTRNADLPVGSETKHKTDGELGEWASDSSMPHVPGKDGVPNTSRRRFLKGSAAAAAGATAALAGCAEMASQGTDPGSYDGDVHMGMALDLDRCIGCLLCAEGCMEENDTNLGMFWMHVFRYEEDEYDDVDESYMPRPCQHCSNPSCSYVCPTQARYKRDEDGIVLTNYDTCIGCRYCQVACPYGVNYLGQEKDEPTGKSPGFWHPTREKEQGIEAAGSPPEGVMGKCTFCVHRQDDASSRGTTACEDACPVDAIHFGDMEDAESAPRQHMREYRETSRFELLENTGNEPNIVYLGDEPTGKAESTDGPYTYRDLDMAPLDQPAEEVEDT